MDAINTTARDDDLLWGAKAFAEELNIPLRKAFYLLKAGRIPARKLGREWVGSRRHVRTAVVGEAV